MKSKGYYFSIFFYKVIPLWLLCHFSIYSQNSSPADRATFSDLLAEQLQSLTKDNVPDLIYLQTSKGIYETEEDVWFKGYVLDSQYFSPSGLSKILFVQLIEEKTDKVVCEKKYEIENGFVNGHLFLENTLEEGTYTLMAYSSNSFTRNVKEFYALKKIEVLKTINHKVTVNSVPKDSILQFNTFPEGGNLVSGIESTLAFKAVNSKGLPVNVSGTLIENDKPLLDFKSSHAGMGSFVFTPDINKQYHIQLTEPASRGQFPLPQIRQNGRILQLLRNTKAALTFKITKSTALKDETVYLRLQVRGLVYSIVTGMLKKELTVKIPLNDIPQGIAEVTLFAENGEPIAERLVYLKQEQKLYIKTELDKKDYATRDKANLKIKVTDQNGQPIVAHLGLSVYDKLYQNSQDSKNIESHYFLSTQLKGNIYNPAYYFNEQNKDRQKALNLLLLTQGWRSYVWEETNLKEQGTTSRPIVFDELKAKVSLKNQNVKVKEPQPQGITVFSADERKGTDLLLADATGAFTITPNDLKKGEGGYTYLKLMVAPESIYRIDIKDFSFEEINKERKNKTSLYPIPTLLERNTEVLSSLADRPEVNKLNEVLITSKKKIVFRDKYIGKLDSLNKIPRPATIYVSGCPNGIPNCPNHPSGFKVTNINTPSPQLTEAQLLEMYNTAMIKGFYGMKVFYEPVYDEVTINDPLPDYRNTLFWKPDIITDEQGEATVSFYCSDLNTSFLGTIEGVSGDGLLGAGNFEFAVRKNKIE